MNLFEEILNETLGEKFNCKAYRDGVNIISRSSDYAIVVGFLFYPGVVQVRENFSVMKCFPEIEDIVSPVFKKHKVHFTSYGGYQATIQSGLVFENITGLKPEVFGNRKDIHTDNESQIRQVATELQKAVEYAVNNFISRYPTLQNVFKSSETMTPKERGEFFAAPAPIRKIVVEALCSESFDLESKFNEYIEEFAEAEKHHPALFKNYAKMTREISERLKNSRII